jgi:predicted dehydrogenase
VTGIALFGCGGWGRNLLRVLVADARARVVAVCDPRPLAQADAARLAPGAAIVGSLGEAIELGAEAAVIATPSPLHGALALEALDAGLDVFVEKPLATTIGEAERCTEKAAAAGRVGMVGHLLHYHPAVVRLLELAARGALGRLVRVDCERLSVTGREQATALWALGPHDLSVLVALDSSPPASIECAASPGGDRAVLEVGLESGATATIALSRSHATKERRIRVVGTSAVALFDDERAPDRVRILSHKGALVDEVPVAWAEPLALEIEHFLDCVQARSTPRTSLEQGLVVVRILAAAELAAERRRLETSSMDAFAGAL